MTQKTPEPLYGLKPRLSDAEVLEILRAGHGSDPQALPAVYRELAQRYNRCSAVIANIWHGRSYAYVHPEIPRLKRSGHGRSKLTDEQVVRVRETWRLHKHNPGIIAALARWARVALPAMQAILKGRHRKHPQCAPASPIPLMELEFRRCPGRGEASGFSKLKDVQVKEIIRLWNEGRRLCGIAQQFDVATATVNGIVTKRSWKHLTEGIALRPKKPRRSSSK